MLNSGFEATDALAVLNACHDFEIAMNPQRRCFKTEDASSILVTRSH